MAQWLSGHISHSEPEIGVFRFPRERSIEVIEDQVVHYDPSQDEVHWTSGRLMNFDVPSFDMSGWSVWCSYKLSEKFEVAQILSLRSRHSLLDRLRFKIKTIVCRWLSGVPSIQKAVWCGSCASSFALSFRSQVFRIVPNLFDFRSKRSTLKALDQDTHRGPSRLFESHTGCRSPERPLRSASILR